MSYDYQTDNMDALRVTFEDMLEDIHALQQEISLIEQEHEDEIADLRSELSEADDAIMELYHEANDLERELHLLRERYHQDMFDAQEDMIELEREYNALYDATVEAVHPDFDDDQWDLFEVTNIRFH